MKEAISSGIVRRCACEVVEDVSDRFQGYGSDEF